MTRAYVYHFTTDSGQRYSTTVDLATMPYVIDVGGVKLPMTRERADSVALAAMVKHETETGDHVAAWTVTEVE